jgi:ATP-dependent RNA helicase DHX37/DHR1
MAKFVPRQRKRRVLDRQRREASQNDEKIDSNAAEIIPASKPEREERRRQLQEELKAQQPQNKISRQKQKRLDKYIETKLKKEENLELLQKVSKTQIDTSLLKSTKELGQGAESKRQIFARALRERDAGINLERAEKILFDQRGDKHDESASEDSEEDEPTSSQVQNNTLINGTKSVMGDAVKAKPVVSFGGGLKRPLDVDESGNPIIAKRVKRNTGSFKLSLLAQPHKNEESDESEWEGFDSEEENDQDQFENVEPSPHNGSESSDEDESIEHSEEDDTGYAEQDVDDEDEKDDGETREEIKARSSARMSAFKAWAEQKRNEALDFTPSNALQENSTVVTTLHYTPRPIEQDPLPLELEVYSDSKRKAYAVQVNRSDDIQTARLKLPVVAKEQEVMEAIFHNDTVIISGTTGSGKTTQVPQFLFENGFGDPNGPTPGMIGITQPRRVAAVSMSKRVSDELGDAKDRVSYQIRFDTTVGNKTAIKFMTDGVLLREMAEDFALRKYSAIVIDEAHERTVNTDILISLMSRCVKARADLAKDKPNQFTPIKLIIMSATLRVSDFRENQRLFSIPPPLVQIEGRQFEVSPHWARRTGHNFIEEAYKRICRGHRQLPPGGMLVFLTGQNEIRILTRRLKEAFPATESINDQTLKVRVNSSEMVMEDEDLQTVVADEPESYNDNDNDNGEDEDSDLEIEGLDEIDSEFKIENEKPGDLLKVHVLPLYSQLPSKEQLRVFEAVPERSRLIVLATNVAETSLTIPGIRYVFDSGRAKERRWDSAGVQTFETTWVSKASADQRMGRAGRTGPGHCYRLYSSAIYEAFKDFAEPEIYRSPLEGVVLQLKALNIARIDNFPFPTPPDRVNLVKAESLLCHLGALDSSRRITNLGLELHKYPLSPRFAQMLRLGVIHKCVSHATAMVAALDVPEIFIPESLLDLRSPDNQEQELWTVADEEAQSRREARAKAYRKAHNSMSRLSHSSDAMKLFAAVIMYNQDSHSDAVCEQYFMRSKALKEVIQLRDQLKSIVKNIHPDTHEHTTQIELSDPSEKEVHILRQIVAAGFVDQVAIRADLLPNPPILERKPKRAIDVRYQTLLPSYDKSSIQSEEEKYVFLHPSSVLANNVPSKLPAYVVYHRLQRSQSSKSGIIPKTRMFPLTPVTGEQLAVLARGTDLIEISKPRGKVAVLPSIKGRERRQCHVDLSILGRRGEIGWTLARKEVIQRRETGEGWIVESFVS